MRPFATHRRLFVAGAILVAAGGLAGAIVFVRARKARTLDSPSGYAPESGSTEWWHPPPPAPIPDGGCPPVETSDAGGGPAGAGALTRFAVIGDYGFAGPAEEAVADMVKAWRPEFVLTLGDNNYPLGGADTIDLNIGLFYHDFIAPYVGRFGCGATTNRFFPALGNHDWMTENARPYLDYFVLPGNERYYDVAWGPVQVFALDSDPSEPDGITESSVQAEWLRGRLAASTAPWKIVYMHHAPYSSGPHGSTPALRWPYKAWGANLVLAGHDHDYERIDVDGLPYVVNGLGGTVFYPLGTPVEGSVRRFNEREGAIFVEATTTSLRARFQTVDGRQIDAVSLAKP
jgi:tartrate-resistant acid phosphatase type 5